VSVELTVPQERRLLESAELLKEYGFEVEAFGGRTYLVRAVPAMLADKDIAEAVGKLLDELDGGEARPQREVLAASLACHSAVRAGQALALDEMRSLLRQLEETASPHTCPHGRPTMMHLSAASLERQFGRRG
jgi:DNA mismatch repair protein MutL